MNSKNTLIQQLQYEISNNAIKRDVVDRFAEQEKIESMQIGEMTRGNLANLEKRDKPVFDALTSLQQAVDEINPHNFKPSFLERLFGKTGANLKKYFQKFEASKDVLNGILKQLEDGKQTLLRDNIALEIEATRNAELVKKLQIQLNTANEANEYIESYLKNPDTTQANLLQNGTQDLTPTQQIKTQNLDSTQPINSQDSNVDSNTNLQVTITNPLTAEKREEIQNQILFPLKQKIMDFQQQILVHSQGEIAIKTLISNNKELANSVDRTKSVTINALNVAIIIAQGLDQQQRVLKAVQDINTQTSELIAQTSNKLKEQGVQIQQGAANAMLDMEKLKNAFDNVLSAMEDMKNFKTTALPKMQENINLYGQYLEKINHATTQA